MKNKTSILTAIAIAASVSVSQAADITGKITLKGTAPANPVIDLKSNPDCGKLHAENPKQPFFTVGDGGALADVVVSLKGDNLKGKSTGASAEPLKIDQKGCMYLPYVSAAQTGQKLLVKNSDTFLHNVHPTPNAPGNKEKNVAQFPNKEDTFVFDTPESFLRFKCDVHPWMFAYVSVFDHPYFAVSQKDGTFTIKNVPAGKYTIEATHRKAGTVSKEIEVKDQNVTADLALEVK